MPLVITRTVEVNDKRCKDSWISAIVNYQASKIQKVTLSKSQSFFQENKRQDFVNRDTFFAELCETGGDD
ncbi:hypothetical protein H6G96_39610 [Nostoc sp. FACHB-892]|uniref:hypothetical protein n=1 Tax=Nostoc sp. FACHB-892 TaxID=2692843 RepID=UPI00168998BB|nr:hypothetical protein [Nostoc sp. FACHB-892]MBD2732189.1 hypothetical protein [Nostoc sp. FACHB-892]